MITPAEVSAVANSTSSAKSAPTEKSTKSAAAAAADFDNFLSLLTAQLRNQDPTSPLDSTQFVEQLASFSSVEQQIETNRLLEEMVGGAGKSDLGAAASWIGREVEAKTENVHYSGAPLEFGIPSSAAGAPSEIIVRNASGSVVFHQSLGANQQNFTWDGVDDLGDAAPEGDYKISVEYTNEGAVVEKGPVRTVSTVTEARIIDGGLNLVLENGALVDPATVSAIRIKDDQTS